VVSVPETESIFDALGNIITDKLEKFVEKISPKEKRYAPFLQFADTITAPGNGFAVMKLQGPTRGRFWYVRKLRVSGVNPLAITASGLNDVTIANPGAGLDFAATVPFNQTWRISDLQAQLSTNATVQNRTPALTITDPSNTIVYTIPLFAPGAPITATQTDVVSAFIGAPTVYGGVAPALTAQVPIPDMILPGGWSIKSNTPGLSGGDQWINIRAGVTVTNLTRADIFIGADDLRSIASLAQCPITTWRDQLTTIPQVQSYGVGELRVGPQEAVYVVLSNASSGIVYVSSLEAYEWPDVDENVEWVM
jgi:hypothetical protein